MISTLPEESQEQIVQYLYAPDVLNLLSTNSRLYRLGLSSQFWKNLKHAQYYVVDDSTAQPMSIDDDTIIPWKEVKDSYILRSHCNALPALKWYPVLFSPSAPTSREGHLSCRLGNYIVITGGFSDDDSIYVKDVTTGDTWHEITPEVDEVTSRILPVWVYGATLTAIDNNRAVRFGGFQSGGYHGETHQVAILHLRKDVGGRLHAYWTKPECKFPDGTLISSRHGSWRQLAARAYHSSILIFDRYIFVAGGMKSNQSILNPLLLDTETWTWYYEGITVSKSGEPSSRFGASIIDDITKRGRLVLFGGANGSDLLRSGTDKSDVWELDLSSCDPNSRSDITRSFPWHWNQLHEDQPNPLPSTSAEEEAEKEAAAQSESQDQNQLTALEKLNLGRCHGSYRVGDDTVLFCFGSGRPTTNSCLGYRLDQNSFFRPQSVQGKIPPPRFTFASVALIDIGYIVFHGGYVNHRNASNALGDTWVLDLAAGMKRPFRLFPVFQELESSPPVTDQEALSAQTPQAFFARILEILLEEPEANRPARAARMLEYLETRGVDGRSVMLLFMVSSGQMQLTSEGLVEADTYSDDDDT